MSEKTDIKSMDLEELKTFFSDMGEKAFRAKQVYELSLIHISEPTRP